MPLHFTAMEFNPSLQGNQYALIVMNMLINYTQGMLIQTEWFDEGVYVYVVHIYSLFGGSP